MGIKDVEIEYFKKYGNEHLIKFDEKNLFYLK